jgi:Ankyrin repeats (3 copies)/Ankyrin repeats (many copies)
MKVNFFFVLSQCMGSVRKTSSMITSIFGKQAETKLVDAAEKGNLSHVRWLVEQGVNKNAHNQRNYTPVYAAAKKGHLDVVQYLVEEGVPCDKCLPAHHIVGGDSVLTPLLAAVVKNHFEIARYLLEQGADKDKELLHGSTYLHSASMDGHLEIAKLLMVYGADLNARDNRGQLAIDVASTEEIKQAIRDEPRRRMDEAPGKRAIEQDRNSNVAGLASTQQEEVEEHSNKRPRIKEGTEAEEGTVLGRLR